jgi:hypothetical protein
MSDIPQLVLIGGVVSFRSSRIGARNGCIGTSECHKVGTNPLLSRRVHIPVHISSRLYMNSSSREGLVVVL